MAAPETLLFAVPPTGRYRRDDRCQSDADAPTARVLLPPLQLAYMASRMERIGFRCRIADCPAAGTGTQGLLALVRRHAPRALVVQTTAPTLPADLEICRAARDLQPDLRILLTGAHLQKTGREVLAHNPCVEAILTEGPEFVIERLFDGTPAAEVPNLIHRSGQAVSQNRMILFDDYDLLPTPARHLLDNGRYRIPDTGKMLTTVEAARGCSGRCVFCPVASRTPRRIRTRSVHALVREVDECTRFFGIDTILLNADNFTANRAWVQELCRALVERGTPPRWVCNSRVDTVDRELLSWMRRAGCTNIGFGIESGSPEMLARMRKGIRPEAAREALEACRAAGITSHAFFVIGLPWESRQTLEETDRFLRTLPADFFDIHIAYPLPNTAFHAMCRREGLFVRSLTESGYTASAVRTHHLGPDELERARKAMLRRLFLRPRYVARTLGRVRTPRELRNYVTQGWRKARTLW